MLAALCGYRLLKPLHIKKLDKAKCRTGGFIAAFIYLS